MRGTARPETGLADADYVTKTRTRPPPAQLRTGRRWGRLNGREDKMKALVVDDSRAMRVILSQALKEAGFTEIAQAQHGKEGLDYLVGHPDTNLALVDWQMPEFDGVANFPAPCDDLPRNGASG